MKKVIAVLLFSVFLFGCKQALITERYHEVLLVNEDTGAVIYEEKNQNKVDAIISKINNTSRTDTFDTVGSIYQLILIGEDTQRKIMLFKDSGNVIMDNNLIKTDFRYMFN